MTPPPHILRMCSFIHAHSSEIQVPNPRQTLYVTDTDENDLVLRVDAEVTVYAVRRLNLKALTTQ